MIPEGGSAKLICKARGYPEPKILWRREDGGDIIVRTGTTVKTKSKISSISKIITFHVKNLKLILYIQHNKKCSL